jgi:hypothetical protein
MKDENGYLLTDSHKILNRRKDFVSQLLNIYRNSNVRQIDIHTAEPLVPDCSPFDLRIYIAIAELINYKSPGKITVELL